MKTLAWLGAVFYLAQSVIYWLWLPALLPGVAFASSADQVGVLTMFAGLTLGIGAGIVVLTRVGRFAEAIVVALTATTGLAVVRGAGILINNAATPQQLTHFALEMIAPVIAVILWPRLREELGKPGTKRPQTKSPRRD
jgi:hypothetical protein